MPIQKIELRPLTVQGFEPYGTLLAPPLEPDEHTVYSETFTFYRNRCTFRSEDGILGVGVSHILKRPFRSASMERHFTTDEINVPLNGDMVALFAKPTSDDPEELPDINQVEAFLLHQGQAVVIKKGVWHWCPMPVTHDTDMLCGLCYDLLKYDDLVIKAFADEKILEVVME